MQNTTMPKVGNERMSQLGLARDSMGYVDGMNTYQAMGDNPINMVDPEGTQFMPYAGNGQTPQDIARREAGDRAAVNQLVHAAGDAIKVLADFGSLSIFAGCSPGPSAPMGAGAKTSVVDILRKYMNDIPEVKSCVLAIDEQRLTIQVSDMKDVGSYPQASDDGHTAVIYVSTDTVKKGNLPAALVIYGEFIHTHIDGGPNLPDGQAAEDKLDALRNKMIKDPPAGIGSDEVDWIKNNVKYPGAKPHIE